MLRRNFWLAWSLGCFLCSAAIGGDWPQILGPGRDGHAVDEKAPVHWSKSLTPAWTLACGEGYAGVAIAEGQVVVFDRVADGERVRLISLADGTMVWSTPVPTNYAGGINPDRGPRCVPVIEKNSVIVYGASGQLSCLDRKTGKVVWTRDARKEYGADDGYFGAGSSPLVVDSKVIVAVGGKKRGGVVAFRLDNGAMLWESIGAEASYASPILLKGSSGPSLFVPTRLVAYGMDLEKGKVLYQFPFGQRGPTVNAATPVLLSDGSVFLTASYGIGSTLAKPTSSSPSVVYSGESLLSSQYATPIVYGDMVYGSDGREDMGSASIKCVDVRNKKVLWTESGFGICHLVGFKDHILGVTLDGRVVLFEAKSNAFQSVTQAQLPAGMYRALPAFSQGTLVVRHSDGPQSEIRAFR